MAANFLAGRCPWCRRGRIFRGLLAMYPACPSCGRSFEPEPGYFVGAMYFSYFLAVPLYALLCLLALRLLGERPMLAFSAALLIFAPLAPLLFRISRILWLYLDCWLERRIG